MVSKLLWTSICWQGITNKGDKSFHIFFNISHIWWNWNVYEIILGKFHRKLLLGKICNGVFNNKKSRRQEVLRKITVAKFERTLKKMSALEIMQLYWKQETFQKGCWLLTYTFTKELHSSWDGKNILKSTINSW